MASVSSDYSLEACVWELTLACNASCRHCGSSAGKARPAELDTKEALVLVADLASMGCRSVTLSGGEPLLRRDWFEIALAIRGAGMRLEMITNGLEVAKQADRIAEAGFFAVTFSVDGTREVHDNLRLVPGGLEVLLEGARELIQREIPVGAVTQVNKMNRDNLDALYDLLKEHGFKGWQVQLTMPHGRARENREVLCLAPADLPSVEKRLLAIRARSDMFIQAADNFGYMGKGEAALRGGVKGVSKLYAGCNAGMRVVGITSDGRVRGCLSLPPEFDEGSIREQSISKIWKRKDAFSYNRQFLETDLTGACRKCPLNKICRAGCRSLAYASTGTLTHNPYCLRRIEEQWE